MNDRVRIKICGVTHEEHVHAAAEAGADLIGVVLWPGSPRAVTMARAMELATLARALQLAPVALVVDDMDLVTTIAAHVDHVQCHGAETCADLARGRTSILKGFPFTPDAVRTWDACPAVQWLVIDGPRGGGGSGFDHAALSALMPALAKPVLLAGGLTVDTVNAAIRTVRPFGVDVSSGVERTRGVKDPELIRAFCRAVRQS